MKTVARYIFPSDATPRLTSSGLLLSPEASWNQPCAISLEAATSGKGGILVSEGGMGKSTWLELYESKCSFACKLIRLKEYLGDPEGLRADLASFSQQHPGPEANVLVDGLDEAEPLIGPITRYLRETDKTIWIASRSISQLTTIRSARPDLQTYNLTPLSEDDTRVIATDAGINASDFIRAAMRQGVLPICAKPLGLEIAINEYRENGLNNVIQKDLWASGVARLCDETTTGARPSANQCRYTRDEIVECASWLALCSLLTERQYFWVGIESETPEASGSTASLVTGLFPIELIETTLMRGVFRPIGDGRITFSHTVYRDYLSARGCANFIPATRWEKLFLANDRSRVLSNRSATATWLTTYNSGFLETISAVQPELLLASVDSLHTNGLESTCRALLSRASVLSFRQRNASHVRGNMFRLTSDEVARVVKECIADRNSSQEMVELATSIAEECEFNSIAGDICNRVVNLDLPHRHRIDAAYAVCKLNDGPSKIRLLSLLPISPVDDPDDCMKGLVLRACWPSHMPYTDILRYLTLPQKNNFYGAYAAFLEEQIPVELCNSLQRADAPAFLTWSKPYIADNDPYARLGNLARLIYSLCWSKWGDDLTLIHILADVALEAMANHSTPFYQREQYGIKLPLPPVTPESLGSEQKKRITVLREVLRHSDAEDRVVRQIPFDELPLYTQADLEYLLDEAINEKSHSEAANLIKCINKILRIIDISPWKKKIIALRSLHPDLISDFAEISLEKAKTTQCAEDTHNQWEARRAEREAQDAAAQDKIDQQMKIALNSTSTNPATFASIAAWLNSSHGHQELGSINLRESEGWGKLGGAGRQSLISLAKRYLDLDDIQPTPPSSHRRTEAYALTLLRSEDEGHYRRLPPIVWRRCGTELLKCAYDAIMDYINPLLDDLSNSYPAIAEDCLLEAIAQERDGGFASAIRRWGERLTDSQSQAIACMAGKQGSNLNFQYTLLAELANAKYKDLARNELRNIFIGGWKSHPEPEFHRLRSLAFALDPSAYIADIITTLIEDPTWSRAWIEASLGEHTHGFESGFFNCDSASIGLVYEWLHNQYPDNTKPEHDGGAYTPEPLDHIHDFKNHIINYLASGSSDGSVSALEYLSSKFPGNPWLKDCIAEARAGEADRSALAITMPDIISLCAEREGKQRTCMDIEDLLLIVIDAMHDYQVYLQGDNPAIRDLWDGAKSFRPRDEEYLSDHLKRYLDLRLKSGVIINREVQIRRKLHPDGEPGSRTDLWVQAIGSNDDILTLCIEVKCNWNGSAKTALENQLVRKYLSGGTATAGILLLGWFACNNWDKNDSGRMRASTVTWPNRDHAAQDLQRQVLLRKATGPLCEGVVIDCILK